MIIGGSQGSYNIIHFAIPRVRARARDIVTVSPDIFHYMNAKYNKI